MKPSPPKACAPSAQRGDEPERPLWLRLAWLLGLWAASVGLLLALATLLRWVLRA